MVRKERVGVPKPKSEFFSGICVKCGTENIFYSNSTKEVKCKQCGEILAYTTGGKVEHSENLGPELKRLDFT